MKAMVITDFGRAVTVTGIQGDLNAATFKNITVHFVPQRKRASEARNDEKAN